jgi:hypothetical protein
VMSGLALQFLSAEADKEYARSKCLRHMNLQTVIAIAICPSRTNVVAKTTCALCDASHTKKRKTAAERATAQPRRGLLDRP